MASSLRVREAALIHDMALQIVLHRRTVAEFGPASLEAGIAHQPDSTGQHAILFALLAGTGLRIGEALALRVEDVGDRVIRVAHGLSSVTGEIQSPKTKNGVREVDLHPALALLLNQIITVRHDKLTFLFDQRCQRVVLEDLHDALSATGSPLHAAFTPFAATGTPFSAKLRVPDGLIQFWMGHARASMTDTYDKVRDDLEFRRFTAEQVGLGFECPRCENQSGRMLSFTPFTLRYRL